MKTMKNLPNDFMDKFIELEVIFNSLPAYIFIKDKSDTFLRVNRALSDAYGIPIENMIGKTSRELFPDFSEKYYDDDIEVITSGIPKNDIIEPFNTKFGVRWAHTNKIPYVNKDGIISGIIGLSIDITDLIKSKNDLELSEHRYKTLVNNLPDIIYSIDRRGCIIDINHDSVLTALLGYSRDELIGNSIFNIIYDEDREKYVDFFNTAIQNRRQYSRENQYRLKAKEGFVLWFEGNSHYTYNPDGTFIQEDGVLRDITEKKVIETELNVFATMDIMTDVYNRRFGTAMLEKQLQIAKRNRLKTTICFIDVDTLKKVNDTYGHSEGDYLIVTVAYILKKCARDSDIIARMGGDEFLYVLSGCDLAQADIAWQRIVNELAVINKNSGKPFTVSISKGFSEFDPDSPQTPDQLIAIADRKMYVEKNGKKQIKT
jgi:diguanylate cyclase (GGDEF)-like protein/PAS domain S-box-containing protein